MKKLFFLLVALTGALQGSAQKYALIDKGWKKAIIYADTVSQEDFNAGRFAVYTKELDTLTRTVEKLSHIFEFGMKRVVFDMNAFATEHVSFDIANIKFAYGDRYEIKMTATTDATKIAWMLCESRLTNLQNQAKIKAFLKYLKFSKPSWPGFLQ